MSCQGIQNMKLELRGTDALIKALEAKSQIDFEKVRNKSLLEMRDRAVRTQVPSMGGTPIDSSELRLSAGVDLSRGYMGYTKHYAPHVEYGHRQEVGRFVPAIKRRLVKPFVPGKYFLKNNLRIQGPKFNADMREALKKDD